ncbi:MULTISPECIES: hypothetical protein [Streptomyces]|uniref:Integral membrane protein n=1 Tax=Streptomyces thermoviolaceus subsp. thermoviolaceus TaxID=66860 RepID=A0ABX0YUX5_STRTL|nr:MULTISPECIES: hypothetical protein [Streptomyces]MCM3266020.1 hypothetical protein [Streptomyces thermoviolaceus]NJP16228.1 hypothetical protein [Streptomyces thermoviolaceus subsp. thermoviolaceus]RSS08214.1 hypothetical protein EF917_02960 [Streptomyces sp. WAC00469]WTD50497.1 hypothetical protein OG899_25065 [Streptomyces thermoviolaceus]GGV82730.1 hypothetical protein GCM10010499_48950 [Streptomyces thermoviolaceus subsp. apingens]
MTIRFAPTPQEPSVAVAEDTGRDGPAAGDEAPAADGPETDHPAGRASVWPARIAAAALMVCGAAHVPLHRQGVPLPVCALALAVSVLCAALALLLAVRPGVGVLVASAVGPGLLAPLGWAEERFASAGLSRMLSVLAAPPPGAGLTAACASLASLAALSLLLMVQAAEHPASRSGD